MEPKANKAIIHKLELSSRDYYRTHLYIVTGVLDIRTTPKEIEVLAAFMALEGEVAEFDRFGTTCRKIVMQKLDMSDSDLSNRLRDLTKKGILINTRGKLAVREIMVPELNRQEYHFLLINKDGKTD